MSDTTPDRAFVRTEMLGPSAPPASTSGALGWVRENLFRGPVNSAITILILGLILWTVPGIMQWAFIDAVWFATSLSECRALGEGACWAVIVERFDQFIYGFYPADERWRPNLAFILMLVAFAFALFDEMPGVSADTWTRIRPYGLIFSACYPFVAYWLIWGGDFWSPLMLLITPLVAIGAANGAKRLAEQASPGITERMPVTLIAGLVGAALWLALLFPLASSLIGAIFMTELGTGGYILKLLALPVGWAVYTYGAEAVSTAVRGKLPPMLAPYEGHAPLAAAVLAGLVWFFLVAYLLMQILGLAPAEGEGLPFLELEKIESKDLGGFLLATIIGVAGIVLSLPIGILLALGRRSGLVFIQSVCIIFIEFIRGVPLITLLFVASSVLAYLFPPDSNLDLVLRVVIMVTAFASAYMAEVVRGGLASLPPGQFEAADAMGLNYWQATQLIVMPQALKVSIPNIVSTFIGLFKDTTLVVVIGLLDPIGLISTTRADAAWNGIIWEFYIFVGFFFFVACFAMSRYSMYLERKLATDRR
ncbi:MAG: amino acid ABC transporter permease [Pseudomonadota bacterium]